MQTKDQTINAIMKNLIALRRAYPEKLSCTHAHQSDCFFIHEQKLAASIASQQPIRFILPAFPAKSPNPNKTATAMPDLGERLALKSLNQLCKKIHAVYPLGVEIVICSDGRVFNDLVKVSDNDVNAYAQAIQEIIYQDHLSYLTTFSLDNYYCQLPYEVMREKLMYEFGESLTTLKERVKNLDHDKKLFNGIHRFIFEDQHALFSTLTKNKIRTQTKTIAYEVIRRSNAWSRLLEKHFPEAVRLSIHPQLCGSEKFGILLLKSEDAWATPWHRVVVQQGHDHVLARKATALQNGAKPVYINQTFSHYVMD
jgi:pyoverdine/dityrosine biosynthesis protein Dit1